jgi:hypothetical protein
MLGRPSRLGNTLYREIEILRVRCYFGSHERTLGAFQMRLLEIPDSCGRRKRLEMPGTFSFS